MVSLIIRLQNKYYCPCRCYPIEERHVRGQEGLSQVNQSNDYDFNKYQITERSCKHADKELAFVNKF